MVEKPLITVLIPTYQRSERLTKAIQSVIDQTEGRFQICVYDNASEDETQEIVLKMRGQDSRIHYYAQEKRVAAAENFQKALQSATTPYFCFLADDDLLSSSFFETALQKFASHPEALFFLGSTLDVTEKGEVLSQPALFWPDKELFLPPEGIYPVIEHYFNWTGALFKKEILMQGLQLDPLITAIDLDFVLQAAARFPFVFSKEICAFFTHHSGSYSGKCGVKIIYPGWNRMVEKLMQANLGKERDKIYAAMQTLLKCSLRRIGARALSQGHVNGFEEVIRVYREVFPKKTEAHFLSFWLLILKKIPLLSYTCLFPLHVYRFFKRGRVWLLK